MPIHRIEPEHAGERVDVWLGQHGPDVSRSRAQQLIREGHALINGRPVKPHHTLHAGDQVEWTLPPVRETHLMPEAIPLDILFEDEVILVLNKPAGLVVHPAAGHADGTLVNALLHHCADLGGIGGELRPGIVHRLDKDTSGVMIIAKTETALHALSHAFKERAVTKTYLALVRGRPEPAADELETLIGRDPYHRKRMSARVDSGRIARTRYRTRETYAESALLDVHIETGRTHQIRVHMAYIGHPILGDHEYGKARSLADGTPVTRQMLHAATLSVPHPTGNRRLEFNAPMPDDMRELIQHLRAHGSAPGSRNR